MIPGTTLLLTALVVLQQGGQTPRPQAAPEATSQGVQVFATPADLAPVLTWRELGPGNHSGRVVDIAVHPKEPSTYYVAAATGGLWKTTDRGNNFTQVFKQQGQTAIGDVALDPSAPDTIWVGTGEANNQRSSYHGDGLWRSTDGGKSWEHMGLPDSHHIGRIVVDPRDGKRVFVAVLGHLYTSNAERGLYRTTDGGRTWDKVIDLGDRVGVVDVALQPGNPDVVLACSYERLRRAWHFTEGGEGSRVWRSTDGGRTFSQVREGLPEGRLGRIGVAFAPSKPEVAYLTVENLEPRPPRRVRVAPAPAAEPMAEPEPEAEPGTEAEPEDDDEEFERYADPILAAFFGEEEEPGAQGGAQEARPIGGEVYRSDDGGLTWRKTTRQTVGGSPGYYYGQVRVDPRNPDEVYVLSVPLFRSRDGGRSFKPDGASRIHVDNHALWLDPANRGRMLLGNDGGLCESWDDGKTWIHFENLPIGRSYTIGVDRGEPYRAFGGTQDNGSWCVPSRGPIAGGPRLVDCFKVSGGDGFYTVVDQEDPNTVYSEIQFGGLLRTDLRTMRTKGIRPRPAKGEAPYRFNWMSPILVSPNNHTTVYFGGNKLFRSLDRGEHWETISGDLTTADPAKVAGNVPHCTITTVDESPLRPGVLYVGTDDGKLWLTVDDGQTWRDMTASLPREARGLWISRVVASRWDPARVLVAVTGYREDRFEPLLFVSDDHATSFRPISDGLPQEAVNVVREDPRNARLLFVGTEGGAWVSVDRGGSWRPLGANLPRVPVHDLVVHPDVPEVVLGTHGRGIWVCDVSLLEGWPGDPKAGPTLLQPRDLARLPRGPMGGYMTPVRKFRGQPVENRTLIAAWFPTAPERSELEVVDLTGTELRSFDLPARPGLHVVAWDLQRGGVVNAVGNAVNQLAQRAGFRGGRRRANYAPSGTYRVELVQDGRTTAAKAFRLE